MKPRGNKRALAISVGVHVLLFATFGIATAQRFNDYTAISGFSSSSISVQTEADDDDARPVKRRAVIATNIEPKKDIGEAGDFISSGSAEDPPVPLEPIRVSYPDAARSSGVEGLVVLEVFIDENGLVRKTAVLRSPHSALSLAAAASVEGKRFRPARIDGKPHAVRMRMPLRFTLQ